MKKTAVIYDKWLDILGGGEVLACTIANILIKNGYDVTFICGKLVDKKTILKKLNIDMNGVNFIEIWNDEEKIKEISKNKDLFINCTFMDYTFGYAKKNIFYTYFPTEAYTNIKGMIFNKLILPNLVKYIKPIEFIKGPSQTTLKNHQFMYLIGDKTKIAFPYLNSKKEYILKFFLFYENLYKLAIENTLIKIDNAKIINKQILVNQENNFIKFLIKLRPLTNTVYLIINLNNKKSVHYLDEDKIYLLYPKIISTKFPKFIYELLYERFQTRLRAGIFSSIIERLKSYDLILSISFFTSTWIKKYWGLNSKILYPPVNLINGKANKKLNWICNLGRFFTLGQNKKQDVLIQAFKRIYNKGYKNWQLHLIGGLSKNKHDIQFMEKLKKMSKNYPVYFHINIERKKVIDILCKSKIYWHATGYGENKKKNPIRFEHFGIAPIEAISARCIPVLFKGGGLTEIIKILGLPEKLHTFSTIDELINNTIEIIERAKKGEILLSKESLKRLNNNFSNSIFETKFINLIKD